MIPRRARSSMADTKPAPIQFRVAALPIAVALLLATSVPAQDPPQETLNSYQMLGRNLSQMVIDADWGGGTLTALVMDVERGIRAFELKSRMTMPPGSIQKVMVAAAALDDLGEDFRFTTELYVRGPVERRRLAGALIVRGTGDPTLVPGNPTARRESSLLFDRWAKVLKDAKIREVDGPLLLDGESFDSIAYPPGWPLDRLTDPRFPEIAALNYNRNCLDLYWIKGKRVGRTAEVRQIPHLPDYVFLSNNVRLTAEPGVARRFDRKGSRPLISADGYLSIGVEPHDRIALASPPIFFGHALKSRLADNRVKVNGPVELFVPAATADGERADVDQTEQQPIPLRLLDRFDSPPLIEILRECIRGDNNLYAEVVLKALGRHYAGGPGSTEKGTRAVMAFLGRRSIPTRAMVLMDGSGVSSLNRVSAQHVVDFMKAVCQGPDRARIESLFPRSGQGVLEGRLGSGPGWTSAGGSPPRIFAAAGGRPGIQSLAGWAETRTGKAIHFAFFVKDSKLPPEAIARELDRLALEIAACAIR